MIFEKKKYDNKIYMYWKEDTACIACVAFFSAVLSPYRTMIGRLTVDCIIVYPLWLFSARNQTECVCFLPGRRCIIYRPSPLNIFCIRILKGDESLASKKALTTFFFFKSPISSVSPDFQRFVFACLRVVMLYYVMLLIYLFYFRHLKRK